MKNENVDIVELLINNIETDTKIKERIKLYMQTHKNNCNNFIYSKYEKEATFFNTILKSLLFDLSAEIVRLIEQKNIL